MMTIIKMTMIMIIIMKIVRKSHLFDQLTIKAGRTNTEWNTYQSKYESIADHIDQSWHPISHGSNHINHLGPFHLKSAKGNHILLNSLLHICYRKLIYYLICHFVNPSNTNNHLTTYKVGGKRKLNSLQISYHRICYWNQSFHLLQQQCQERLALGSSESSSPAPS